MYFTQSIQIKIIIIVIIIMIMIIIIIIIIMNNSFSVFFLQIKCLLSANKS